METFADIRDELKNALQEDIAQGYMIFGPHIQVEYFMYSENYTYLLCDGQGKRIGIVCVHRPGYHTVQELHDEFVWMTEIREETAVRVPRVYEDAGGNLLRALALPGGRGIYYYTVMEFLPGKPVESTPEGYTAKLAEAVGEMTAQLHVQSCARTKTRAGLYCFHWDTDTLLGPQARWGNFSLGAGCQEWQMLLEKTAQKIKERLLTYPRDDKTFFLIHADLHGGNLMQDKDDIALIDFDDCGYSWFLYDLGAFLSHQNDQLDMLAHHWCQGYEKVRPLRNIDLDMLSTFVLLRRLVRLGWLATRANNDVVDDDMTARYLEKTAELAEKYLRS